MQQFFLIFLLFLDSSRIFALELLLHQSINISSIPTINDFDHPQIRATLNHFIKWFTPVLAIFSLLIALVCPFLLWILQERCLYGSSSNQNCRSTTLISTPRLLLIDPRRKLPKSYSPSVDQTLYYSSDSSKHKDSYHTTRTSFSSVDSMV